MTRREWLANGTLTRQLVPADGRDDVLATLYVSVSARESCDRVYPDGPMESCSVRHAPTAMLLLEAGTAKLALDIPEWFVRRLGEELKDQIEHLPLFEVTNDD